MAESGLILRENPLLCLTKGLIPSGTRFFNALYFSSAAKEKDLMILGWNDHKRPKSLLLEAKRTYETKFSPSAFCRHEMKSLPLKYISSSHPSHMKMCAVQLTYLTSMIQTPRGKHTFMCEVYHQSSLVNNLRFTNEIKIDLEVKKKSILQTSSTLNLTTQLGIFLNIIRY